MIQERRINSGKPIRLTRHAKEQSLERGASAKEIELAIRLGNREPARKNRELCRYNFPFGQAWHGKKYSVKQVAPLIVEDKQEIVVITVYTFYF